jgi:hypothetical protein
MHTTNHSGGCLWYVPTLAYLWYLVLIPPRIGSDFVPTLRVGIRILYLNLGYGIVVVDI